MDTIPERWHRLGGVKRDVLATLAARGPATGSKVREALGRPYSERTTIYRALDELREAGLVETDDKSDDDRAKSNRLTDDGRDLVERGVVDVAERVRLAEGGT